MAELLKGAKLSQRYGVTQMDVDPRRVYPILDPQGLACPNAPFELLPEFRLGGDLIDPSANDGELLFERLHNYLDGSYGNASPENHLLQHASPNERFQRATGADS